MISKIHPLGLALKEGGMQTLYKVSVGSTAEVKLRQNTFPG